MTAFRALIVAALLAAPGTARASRQDLEIAQGVLEKALSDHPGNAELHTLLGFVLRKMEKLSEAEKSFERAVAANPDKAEAHFMLGLIREKKGSTEAAIAAWKACLKAATEPGMRETARRHLAVLEKK